MFINKLLYVLRTQMCLSRCNFAFEGRQKRRKRALLSFFLPVVPCTLSPETKVSGSPLFTTKVQKNDASEE